MRKTKCFKLLSISGLHGPFSLNSSLILNFGVNIVLQSFISYALDLNAVQFWNCCLLVCLCSQNHPFCSCAIILAGMSSYLSLWYIVYRGGRCLITWIEQQVPRPLLISFHVYSVCAPTFPPSQSPSHCQYATFIKSHFLGLMFHKKRFQGRALREKKETSVGTWVMKRKVLSFQAQIDLLSLQERSPLHSDWTQ